MAVEGNERIDAASVASFAGIARGEPVSAAELNAAYQNVLESGLFQTVEFEPRGSTLVIRVEERPTINAINIEGNRRLDDDTLLPVVQSASRRVYNPTQAEADADAIAAVYAESGRVSVVVTPRIIRRSENRVDLVFEVDEARNVEVERISFVGNQAFGDARLRRVLATKQAGFLRQIVRADTFVPDRIAFDRQVLNDFYMDRGYIDFQVLDVNSEIARGRDGVFITVLVREGQRYRFGNVSVASEIPGVDGQAFLREVTVRPGTVYTPVAIERSILEMEELALREGIDFARIEPRLIRDPRNLQVGVQFVVSRGPRVFVERIDIEGNTTTLDRVIRRQFDTVEGDPFNPRAIRAAAERIRALGYFAEAEVTSREGSTPNQVVIDVDVEETTTGALSFGASYGADTGLGLSVGLRETNFLGRGQRLAFAVNTTGENASGSLLFFEPALLGRDLGGGVELFYRTTDDFNAVFDTRSIGFSPTIQFPVGEDSRVELRYTIQSDDLSVDDDDRQFVSPILLREPTTRASTSSPATATSPTRSATAYSSSARPTANGSCWPARATASTSTATDCSTTACSSARSARSARSATATTTSSPACTTNRATTWAKRSTASRSPSRRRSPCSPSAAWRSCVAAGEATDGATLHHYGRGGPSSGGRGGALWVSPVVTRSTQTTG